MLVTYEVLSLPGDRPVNEDSAQVCQCQGGLLALMADGLGGHGLGDVASRTVVCAAAQCFLDCGGEEPISTLANCFEHSQQVLLQEQKKQNAQDKMKSTLCALLLNNGRAHVGYVGDSRVYWFRNGKYLRRTQDHSVPQMLVQLGEIREKQIRGHEDRNRLMRVMGTEWDEPKYEIWDPEPVMSGDSFLLCSDGLWEWVEEKKMETALKKSKTPQVWLSLLAEEARKKGSRSNMDNYTAVGVFIR